MLKKDTVVIIGCVVLFAVLAALLLFEMKNPEGGVKLLESAFSSASSEGGLAGLQMLAGSVRAFV